MINKFRPISISLSPNVQKDDIFLSLKLLFLPWKWKNTFETQKLEEEFKSYLGVKYAVAFNSGRSSMYAVLKALNLQENSDVLLQAFTCNAVTNPILWAKLNPVYIDCANDFNVDKEDLERKITSKTKVLILQHTFGLPAPVEEIVSDMKKRGIMVIEDCAHALGAEYNGKKVGTIGEAGFYSFSRDKVISCVYGGMAVTNSDEIGKRLLQLQKEFGNPSLFWIKQQILHPILLQFFILPVYNFINLGKVFLIVSQWLHILSKAVSWQEKRGLRPQYFPKALPGALAVMARNQFGKLDMFNTHRKKIANFYYEKLQGTKFILPKKDNNIFLRFAVQHTKAHEILYAAWHKENILLGDWYTTPIAPDDTQMSEMRYVDGMCQNAERLSKVTLNLPTHINISMKDAERIVNFLQSWK